MRVDLHCHSSASDGELPALELFRLGAAAGVELLAITDHDTTAGCRLLRDRHRAGALEAGPALVAGVEVTAVWHGLEVHVVGLDVDIDEPELEAFLRIQQQRRRERAGRILKGLEQAGAQGLGELLWRRVGDGVPGRRHFAAALVEAGHARDTGRAFRRWLNRLRPRPRADWPELGETIDRLQRAGGVAVLAHPLAYRLSAGRCRSLVADFAAAGGEAMEVALPGYDCGRLNMLAELARRHDLLASAGSDFHAPDPWRRPGCQPDLPGGVRPLWTEKKLACLNGAA